VEHAHPIGRIFPWRTIALAASVVALGAGSVVALVDQPAATPAAPGSTRARTAPALPPPRPRSRISVLVLNGNGISGAAGHTAATILARGYRHAVPADAQQRDYPHSVVLYRPGWQREAERLGREVGIRTVATLDGTLPTAERAYPLVVILGAN
jgi:hypothetical protein